MEQKEDRLILVDVDDRAIGSGGKQEVHEKGLLHRAFSVFLFDGDRLLLQQRAAGKYHSAGLWANTCCSHPREGEALDHAVARRLAFECGIENAAVREAGAFIYRACFDNGLTEYEYDHVFVGEYGGEFTPDQEEIAALEWAPLEELKADLLACPERYAPWFFTALTVALRYRAGGEVG